LTAVVPVKLVPAIVTLVPPAVDPELGLTLVTLGGPPGVKLTLSKVAVPRVVALCEFTRSPAVALVLMARVFDRTSVQVTHRPIRRR